MTNFEKIKTMTIDEMAYFLDMIDICKQCTQEIDSCDGCCNEVWEEILKQEYVED